VDDRLAGSGPAAPSWRDGWAWFIATIVSRAYLVLVASLAAIALLPGLLGWHATVVQSGSMEPNISPGDVVLTAPLAADAETPLGRVVSFLSPAEAEPSGVEKIRLHRIVDVNDDGTFVTAGDANADVDSTPIVRDQIIGQARLLVPFVGLPGWWMGHGQVVALLAWLGVTAIALVVLALDTTSGIASGASAARRPRPVHNGHSARHARGPVAGAVAFAPSTDGPDAGPAGSDAAGPGRRAFLSGLGAIAVLGTAVLPRDPADAAFTASTSTGRNVWRVAAAAPLLIGRAATYALLAATSITNQASRTSTWIDGSIATSPGTTISGFWSWNLSGSVDRNTTSARNAKTDAAALAAALDSRTRTAVLAPALTGTIRPGVYTSSSTAFTASGTITLDARGDSSAIFVFRSGTLTTGTFSVIRLINGARPGNVYWRTTGTATLGAGSTGSGTVIAGGNATMLDSSDLTGHLISLNGAVSVDRATVVLP
jgi:signal peptidase I